MRGRIQSTAALWCGTPGFGVCSARSDDARWDARSERLPSGGGKPRPFSDKQIGLLQTFADQAVIAIENVRLFKELEERNRELTEALAQQTATERSYAPSASAQTDVEPVLGIIAGQSATRFCGAGMTQVHLYAGELIQMDSLRVGAQPMGRFANPRRPSRVPARATARPGVARSRTGAVVHMADASRTQPQEFPKAACLQVTAPPEPSQRSLMRETREPIGADRCSAGPSRNRSPTSRSLCSRPSPTRR